MSKKLIEKPSLAEIFYAVSGVTHAGITGCVENKEALISLGASSASFSYNVKEALMQGSISKEEAASKGLEFLKNNRDLLQKFSSLALRKPSSQRRLKPISKLVEHIDDILLRERSGEIRAESEFNKADGIIGFSKRTGNPSYLGKKRTKQSNKAKLDDPALV